MDVPKRPIKSASHERGNIRIGTIITDLHAMGSAKEVTPREEVITGLNSKSKSSLSVQDGHDTVELQ